MRFSLKIQSIGNSSQDTKGYIALTHEFEVTDDQALTKRGRLFLTLNISANANFDLKEASSLFIDSIQESFYRISDETPLHALESSLRRSHQLLLSIKSVDGKDSLGSSTSHLDISCATALVWNRVLYTSHIGSPAIYLIKGAGVRDLVSEKGSHEIWTNSNIIENEDVIIVGTEVFAETFPAAEIINNLGSLSSTITTHPNSGKIAAILIKASASLEKQSSSITEKIKSINIGTSISGTIWKMKSRISSNQALSEKFKLYQSKKAAPVASISGLSERKPHSIIDSTIKREPRRISERKSTNKGKKQISVGLVILIGIGLVNYKLFYENKTAISSKTKDEITFNNSNKFGSIKGEKDEQADPHLHQEIINHEDIEKNMKPISIATITGHLIILDANSGSLFKVDISNGNSIKLDSSIPNAKIVECEIHISSQKDLCFLYGRDGFIVFDANKEEVSVDKYFADLEGIVDIYPSWDVLYILTSDSIYAHAIGPNKELNKLLKENTLSNTKSLAVDTNSNAYLLSSNDVYKYSKGKLINSYKIDKSKLKSPTQIDISESSIYILDQKKIVVFKKTTGEYENEILLSNETDIETPTSFTLTKEKQPRIIFEKGKSFFIVDN